MNVIDLPSERNFLRSLRKRGQSRFPLESEIYSGPFFRTFNIVDDFNREALHIEVDTSITSHRLVRIFEQLKADHGLPPVLRTDNGPEFLGEAFVQWAKTNAMAVMTQRFLHRSGR